MADHDHQQHPNSTPPRIVQEIDFFDEHNRCNIIKPTSSSSLKKRVLPVQETDGDHLEETFSEASTGGNDQKKRKTSNYIVSLGGVPVYTGTPGVIRLFGVNLMKTSDDSSKGIPVYNNPRIIMLFGVNLLMSSDHDQEIKRSKAKGKEKIVDTGNQELEVDDDHGSNSQSTFLIAEKPSVSRATRIIINDEKKKKKKKEKKTENPSNRRKWKNPNVRHQELEVAAPVVAPLFHPRILEELPQEQVLVFLFEKKLQFSDVASSLNRLLITRSEKLMGFLTEEERRKVEDKDEELRVLTRDTQVNEYTLHLTKWHAARMIVLKHDWCKLVKANRLQKGDSVQGWGYRRGDEFRLALNFIRN